MPARTTILSSSSSDDSDPSNGPDELLAMRPSWERALQAENKSRATITGYLNTLDTFRVFLARHGLPLTLAGITRDHCKAFIAEQLVTRKSATAATRFRNLAQFWRWCVDEEERARSPMAGMHQPHIEESEAPVISVEHLSKLLHACRGNDFLARRDTAIIRLLVDCGMRRSEIAHLRLDDINWQAGELTVHAKGNRLRVCSFGKKAARDLDRYLRIRATHRHAATEWLWLGFSGAGPRLCDESIYNMVKRRAREAGIGKVWTHLFRHTFAHMFLDEGGQEGQLMHLGGWRDWKTMTHYGRGLAAARARDAHKLHSPGDRI